MAEPVTTAATATAAVSMTLAASQKVIENVVEDLYAISKEGVREQIRRWRATARIKQLSKKLVAVRRVKTIWQTEKEVDLMEFYYPARLLKGKERREVRSLRELTKEGNILIEGTVGQGKSILLRYLCVQELYRGEVIPILIELRRLEGGTKLLDLLLDSLDMLGFGNDSKIFEFLASSGKILICLDGFDEVKASLRDRLIQQIESIVTKYDELRIVVTSRPDNAIDKSACMRVLRLAPLERGDVRGIIDKLEGDANFTEELLRALDKRHSSIQELLTTPLMVTLLVIAYKAEQQIPETTAEFYEALFNTLLLRHDKLKAGFRRERHSGLNDHAMRTMFDAVCFLCRKQQLTTIEHGALYQICDRAKSLAQVACDPQKFMDDIKQITCLLLEEGGKYHFVHKSVSEYHAASYIQHSTDEGAGRFYRHVLNGKYRNWQQEVEFLQKIDRYRFSKRFLIPDILKFMQRDGATDDVDNVSDWFDRVVAVVGGYIVGFNRDGHLRSLRYGALPKETWVLQTRVISATIDAVVLSRWDEALRRQGVAVKHPKYTVSSDNVVMHEIQIDNILKSDLVEPRSKILQACQKAASELQRLYSEAKTFVAGTEAAAAALDDL